MLIVNESIESILDINGDLQHLGLWKSSILEVLSLESLGLVSGDVWETWVFNGTSFEPSVYSGYSFNSYIFEDGITYAATEEGIYILDGTDDLGAEIHTGVILSPTMFGILNKKRFRHCFLNIDGTRAIIRGEVDGQGVTIPVIKSKVVFPRTIQGTTWVFLVADFDVLRSLEFFPTILPR